ncbi:MAG TPA: hypothetical protein VM123_19285 [archaeon]|nr:hypothetical protein [archaeon]
MTVHSKEDFPSNFSELKKRIEQDKLELERMKEELLDVGTALRADYIRSMLGKSKAPSALGPPAGPMNRMCLKCFNSCKQPEAVKIFHCGKYEPLV